MYSSGSAPYAGAPSPMGGAGATNGGAYLYPPYATGYGAYPMMMPTQPTNAYYASPSSMAPLPSSAVAPPGASGHVVVAGGPSVYGTEKDKYNCPFFIKTGACRHGDKCNRFHPRPNSSVTILMPHLFLNMNAHVLKDNVGNEYHYSAELLQKRVDEFFEDVWMEIMQFGEIVELIICRNTCEQLLGNVYIKFIDEPSAQRAMLGLQNRSFEGRLVLPEFSPVVDFVEACCKQNTDGQCKFREKDLCNFIHTEMPSTKVVERCMRAQISFWKRKLKQEPANASISTVMPPPPPPPLYAMPPPGAVPYYPPTMLDNSMVMGMPNVDMGLVLGEVEEASAVEVNTMTNTTNTNNGPVVVCYYCGDPTHSIDDCPFRA